MHLLAVLHQYSSRLVDPTIHVDDQLVLEPDVSVHEEHAELRLERSKQRLRDLVLEVRWELVVEFKLLDDQIVIIYKSILDELLDGVVQMVRYLLFFVAVLQPQQPEVELLHTLVDQALEGLVAREHHSNCTTHEGKETQTKELHNHAEYELY